jgi:hypothetical protein
MNPATKVVAGCMTRAPDLLGAPGVHDDHAAASVIASTWSGDIEARGSEAAVQRLQPARICTRSFASRFESGSSNRNAGSRTIAGPSPRAGAAHQTIFGFFQKRTQFQDGGGLALRAWISVREKPIRP